MSEAAIVQRRLLLLRHAKAAPAREEDRERPLLPAGREAAALVGRFVDAVGNAPDVVLTSPAVRARENAELARAAAGWSCPLREIAAFYEGTPRGVLHAVREEGGDAEIVLVVGHEPTWSELASRLVGGGAIRLPTAGLVLVELEVATWSDASFGGGVLRWMVTPKLLQATLTPR